MNRYLTILSVLGLFGAGYTHAESYSAMDPKADLEEPKNTAKPAVEAQTQAPAEPQKLVPARFMRERFDLVSKEQVDQLQKRIRLTEEILKKHERAYDYRLLSVKELKEILIKLDTEKKAAKYRGIPRSNT